jgi:hypothetical protein
MDKPQRLTLQCRSENGNMKGNVMWSTTFPIGNNVRHPLGKNLTNCDFLRRYARRLLRNARSLEPSQSLPILRRIVAAEIMPELRITEVYSVRTTLQLKHILHMLAKELGFGAWELCKKRIDQCAPEILDRYRLDLGMFGDYQQNWFADADTARAWQKENGGYLVNVGSQVVAILA